MTEHPQRRPRGYPWPFHSGRYVIGDSVKATGATVPATITSFSEDGKRATIRYVIVKEFDYPVQELQLCGERR